MDLRQLQYFVAVAEERHFGKAAMRCGVAQPGLSQQIRKLERSVSAQLFIRTTRRVQLTEAGVVLLPQARQILADVMRAEAIVDQSVQGELSVLKIGFVSSAALVIVPKLAHTLRVLYPNISLQLNEMTTGDQLKALENGRIDLGIGREIEVAKGCVVEPLVREPLFVAVHDSHRLAAHRSVRLAELAGERFVTVPRQRASLLFDHIAGLCRSAGFQLEIAEEAFQFTTILGLVSGGAGVAVIPEPLCSLQLPGLRYLAVEDEEATSLISIIYRQDRTEASPVRKLLEAAERVFPESLR